MIDLFGEDREPPVNKPSRKFKTMQELYGTLEDLLNLINGQVENHKEQAKS